MEIHGNYAQKTGIILILTVLLQRFSIPFNSKQIAIVFFLTYFFLLYSFFCKRIHIEISRLILFLLGVCSVLFVTLFIRGEFSVFSLIYLITLYFAFIFYADFSEQEYRKILFMFQNLMLFLSFIGILQIGVQLAGVPYDDYFSYLPFKYVQGGYNTSYPIVYGSDIYKANAVVFLEPSFFSQVLAIALIIETVFFKRFWCILIYLVALICTFSGTGLLLLALTFPLWLRHVFKQPKTRYTFIACAVIGLLVFFNSDFIDKSFYYNRIAEFSSKGESANIRFIAPYTAMAEIIHTDTSTFLIGSGAGAVTALEDNYMANFPVIPKLVIEYGLIAGGLFLLFLGYCIFTRQRSYTLAAAVAFMYFILSGSLLQSQTAFFIFLLTVFIPAETASEINDGGIR